MPVTEALSVNVSSSISAKLQETVPPGIVFSGNPAISYASQLSSAQVNKLYFAQRNVTGSDSMNLLNATLEDAFNVPLVFSRVYCLIVVNLDPGQNPLTIGGGSNPLLANSQVLTAPVAGQFAFVSMANLLPVTSTSCLLNVSSGSLDIPYQILIAGS
jgi:hypothetical protein